MSVDRSWTQAVPSDSETFEVALGVEQKARRDHSDEHFHEDELAQEHFLREASPFVSQRRPFLEETPWKLGHSRRCALSPRSTRYFCLLRSELEENHILTPLLNQRLDVLDQSNSPFQKAIDLWRAQVITQFRPDNFFVQIP